MTAQLPNKTVKCHRTGFQETCYRGVTEHECRLWKRVDLHADRETGAAVREIYDCADSLMHTMMLNLLGRQDSTTASVDQLRNEVQQANDSGMANALMGLNRMVRETHDPHASAALGASVPHKMIGSS